MRLGKGAASDITFTPDGTQFAVATNVGIWVYDAKTGAEIALLKQPDRGYGKVAFSPDGNVLAVQRAVKDGGKFNCGTQLLDNLSQRCRHLWASPRYFFLRRCELAVLDLLGVFMYGRLTPKHRPRLLQT